MTPPADPAAVLRHRPRPANGDASADRRRVMHPVSSLVMRRPTATPRWPRRRALRPGPPPDDAARLGLVSATLLTWAAAG